MVTKRRPSSDEQVSVTRKSSSAKVSQQPSKLVSYSLPVKYRPTNLSQLCGHTSVVAALKGMFKSGVVPTTILLCGTSGTGKTTLARMIARIVNCHNLGEDYSPCGECRSCKYETNHPDINEINMADARGIDDVRSLIAASKNMPTLGEHRVFIIDEVHAITPQAAQCLLKPLEEPPKKTLWILATTNPEKLPSTILGRCHRLELRPLEEKDISRRLLIVAKREGVDLKSIEGYEKLLTTMYQLGKGQMRDSLSLLEGVLYGIKSGRAVDSKSILSNFLTSPEADMDDKAAQILDAIFSANIQTLIKVVRTAGSCRGVLSKLRWLVQYMLDKAAGIDKFQPWSAKCFSRYAAKSGVKLRLMKLVALQSLLCDLEIRFNTLNVDESVIMLGMLGDFAAKNAPAPAK